MPFFVSLIRRLVSMLLVLLVVVVLNFLMLHLAPGDIADTIAQTMGGADEQDMAELRKQYGLDQPFFIQLFNYVVRVALLDFGHSHFYNLPVFDLIMERFPATLLLVFSAQILSLFVGILLGVYAAQNPNGLSSLFCKYVFSIWLRSSCILDWNSFIDRVLTPHSYFSSLRNEGYNN